MLNVRVAALGLVAAALGMAVIVGSAATASAWPCELYGPDSPQCQAAASTTTVPVSSSTVVASSTTVATTPTTTAPIATANPTAIATPPSRGTGTWWTLRSSG